VRVEAKRAAALAALFISSSALALDRGAVEKLAFGDGDEKIEAISALVAEADPKAVALLQAFAQGELQVSAKQIFIVRGDKAVDVFSGKPVPLPGEREDVVANNRMRSAVSAALAAFKLGSPDRDERIAAARAVGAEPAMLPLIRKALEKETDPAVRAVLAMTAANAQLKDGTKE
jgi:urea transport system permease protein